MLDVAFAFYQQKQERLNLFASPWQYMASFMGVSAGLVIMSANTEEAALLNEMGAGSGIVFLGVFGVAMCVYACEFD